jgi:Resolvase, N terminal domain
MKYGYARVSTDGQSIDAQVRQLRAAGARQVLREVASGAKTDRAQLRRVLAHLDAGDVLMVTRLDRLARSRRDLLNTLAAIAGRGAGFRSLGDTWADTTTPHGRLMQQQLQPENKKRKNSHERNLERGIRPWHRPWNADHAAGRITRPLRHKGPDYVQVPALRGFPRRRELRRRARPRAHPFDEA